MKPRSRRSFLKATSLLPGLALSGAVARASQPDETSTSIEEDVLAAIAVTVLPAMALGEAGVDNALQRFRRWRDGFEPVAELDHPYLSSDEIRYGPPDPRPLWRSQCAALEIESQKRHARSFASLSAADQELILRRQLTDLTADLGADELPEPARAPHVAIALATWFFSTSQANDLCYEAAIDRYGCRGLPSAVDRPAALAEASSETLAEAVTGRAGGGLSDGQRGSRARR